MKTRTLALGSALLALLTLLGSPARASLVVGNLDQPVDGTIAPFALGAGQEFNTGSLSTSLVSIFIRISSTGSSPVPAGASLLLLTDNGSTPGTLLTTLYQAATIPPLASPADVEFAPLSPIALTANTNYWVVFDRTNINNIGVAFRFTNSATTYGPGSLVNFIDRDGNVSNDMAILMQVNSGVAAVPEPSSLVAFGTGALGLMGLAWRRQAKRSAVRA